MSTLGLAAAFAALLGWGCAPADRAASDAPVSQDVIFHDGVLVPPEPEPTLVTPRGGMARVLPHAFEWATARPGRGLRITFWGGVAPCFVVDRVELSESRDAVTVTLYAGSEPASRDVACIEIALRMAVDVELASPLGERVVLDGASGWVPRGP